jgi:hypothetical protein
MKTFTLTPTLLAITFQAMVYGQTQENQALKIREDIMGSKITNPTTISLNSNETNMDLLIKEANLLSESQNNLKNNLIQLENKTLELNINLASFQIEKNYSTYNTNKQLILKKLSEQNTVNEVKKNAAYFNNEAEMLIKIGLQMIEDATSQIDNSAKLEGLTNANYKEMQALAIQKKALFVLYEESIQNQKSQIVSKNTKADNSKSYLANTVSIISKDNATNQAIKKLIENADNLKVTIDEIRNNAINKPIGEATIMLKEANELEQDYLKRKIELSDLEGQITLQYYNQTKQAILAVLNELSSKTKKYNDIQNLIDEADYAIKISREMREEAKAQQTLDACYGELTNAKEQEIVALEKQSKIKMLLPKQSITHTLVMN